MFYVYHTTAGPLEAPDLEHCTLVDAPKLATMVLDAGLFTWLLRKAG